MRAPRFTKFRRVTGTIESLDIELNNLRSRAHLVSREDAKRLMKKVHALQMMLMYKIDPYDAEDFADLFETPGKLPESNPASH